MKRDRTELEVERLLRSCAIFPMLKGFYPLRDLILLHYREGEYSHKTTVLSTFRYGKHGRSAMNRALRHSWRHPECRLTQLLGQAALSAPPTIEEFVSAICREMEKTPA